MSALMARGTAATSEREILLCMYHCCTCFAVHGLRARLQKAEAREYVHGARNWSS